VARRDHPVLAALQDLRDLQELKAPQDYLVMRGQLGQEDLPVPLVLKGLLGKVQ
jgi:hypothetical protein